MKNEPDAFYLNIDTEERVRVTWRVSFIVSAYMGGYVDVEATTQDEAAELATHKHFSDVEWDYDYDVDYSTADLWDVECEHPPADAILIRPGYKTGANLDALFEPETAEAPGQKANEGGDPCK
jgi:hypothetical protein